MPTSISYTQPVEVAADKRIAQPEHERILHSIHDRCPSCGARRMVESAAHLADHVFLEAPVRQQKKAHG